MVDRELLPIKAHYFLFNAATGPMMQFLPTIANQLGFSKAKVGNIFLILPISGLIAKPLFGSLADKFRLHKTFFIIFQAILAIAFFTINFIPENEPSAKTLLTCDGVSFLELCTKKDLFINEIHKAIKERSSCHLSCDVKTQNDAKALCESWNIDKYCDLAKEAKPPDAFKNEKIEFEALFNESYVIPEKKDSILPEKAKLEVLKNCVHIRVFQALFDNGAVHNTTCDSVHVLRIPCKIQCPKVSLLNEIVKDMSSNEKSEPSDTHFQWFLQAAIVSWVGMAVVVSIADAICFDLLGDAKCKDYGKQSMWGSIGVGLLTISSGYLIDIFSKNSETKNYSCLFYLMLICMSLDILVSTRLKKKSLDNHEPSVLYELMSILREGRVLVFAWWCIGAGMCTAVVWNFVNLYVEEISSPEDQQWLKTLQGLIAGVQCFLGQLPFNFISGNILHKVGHINVMSLVLLAYAIRFMAYSLISNVWMVLFIELLHGPSYGLCWPTMVSYGDKVAPSGTKATIQGLVGAVFEGIGVAIGSFICGHLMDNFNGVVTLRIFSSGALVWLTIYWLMQLLLQRVKAYPLQQGHTHLASYAPDDDAILMTMSQEMQTY